MEEEKKIGIVGHGFVGKAVDKGFSKKVKKILIDPKLGTSFDDLIEFEPDYIFICVPTPMSDDGSQDSTILLDVSNKIKEHLPDKIVILKSTVLPNMVKQLDEKLDHFVYNPEFLREKHAEEDFINSPMVIIGSKKDEFEKIRNLYIGHSNCKSKNFVHVDALSASFIKYSINSFLASKVMFFNQLYDVYQKIDPQTSYKKIVETISLDRRMGDTHMDVPGHDGKKGFGGACFTKDTAALMKFSKEIDAEMSILKEVILANNNIRSSYDALDSREKEQNVNYTFNN